MTNDDRLPIAIVDGCLHRARVFPQRTAMEPRDMHHETSRAKFGLDHLHMTRLVVETMHQH